MSFWSILCVVFLRNRALLVLMCDAVAQGLIQSLCGPDSIEPAPSGDKGKNRAEKGMKEDGKQDVHHKALEVC